MLMFFIFLDEHDDHDEHPILISMLCLLESYPIQDGMISSEMINMVNGTRVKPFWIMGPMGTENPPSRHLFGVKLSSFMYFYVRFTNQIDPNSVSM